VATTISPEKQKEYSLRYWAKNPDARKQINERYREKNREKIRERSRVWRAENREKCREWRRARYLGSKEQSVSKGNAYRKARSKVDPVFRFSQTLRGRINKTLVRGHATPRTVELLGCSFDMLKAHLESRFTDGMSWSNYGYRGWHIDHVIPLCYFDLTDGTDLKNCFHFLNLSPKWAWENQAKSGTFHDNDRWCL